MPRDAHPHRHHVPHGTRAKLPPGVPVARVPPSQLPLTDQQEYFCRAYAGTCNGRQAAIAAGYAPKHAATQASALLKRPHIQARLAVLSQQTLERAVEERPELNPQRVLEEFRRLAFVNPATCFDARGHLRSLHDMDPATRSAIAAFDVIRRKGPTGHVDVVYRVKFWNKNDALAKLATHFGLLTDMMERSRRVGAVGGSTRGPSRGCRTRNSTRRSTRRPSRSTASVT